MNTPDVSALMGQKLLQGWAMLEACCPDCFVPLMRNRSGVTTCLSCNSLYEKDASNSFIKVEKQAFEENRDVLKEPTAAPAAVPDESNIREKSNEYTESIKEAEFNLHQLLICRTKRLLEINIHLDDEAVESKLRVIEKTISCIERIHNFI